MANFPGLGRFFGGTVTGTLLNVATGGLLAPAIIGAEVLRRTFGQESDQDNARITRRTVEASPVTTPRYGDTKESSSDEDDTSESSSDEDDRYSLAQQNRRARNEIRRKRRDIDRLHQRIDQLEDVLRETPVVSAARRTSTLQLEGNNIGVFGLTSRGKSTLVNSLLNKNVAAVGAGETTTEIKAYAGRRFRVWDVPGQNDTLTYESNAFMSLIKGLTHRIILIQSTVKENQKLMRLLDDLDLSYHIVVNKFDTVDEDEQDDFQEQIQNEISKANLRKVKNVFFISAKYPNRYPDWLKMVNILTD